MHLNVVACDLDGTLAVEGVVEPDSWEVLRKARTKGFALILVTGRRLETFAEKGPFSDLFQAIVAEDGAAIYFPRSQSVVMPFGRVEREIVTQLEAKGIPLERGMAIIATWLPHDEAVLEVVQASSGGATISYNKGAVMVLPPGATKGTGLLVALRELGYSRCNVVAIGDAENDRSLFEIAELSVAVANAVPEIKKISDCVSTVENGEAVRVLLESLMAGVTPIHRSRSSRNIQLGHDASGKAVSLSAFHLVDQNIGIVGASATGKSWMAGLLTEELLRLGYQLCIVDPEGDYSTLRAFPHTLVVGAGDVPIPSVTELTTLFEYSDISLILDLSCYSGEERNNYVTELLPQLLALRATRGRPHWFLIDEVHGFCPPKGGPLTQILLRGMDDGGFCLVSFRPTQTNGTILNAVDHWLLTRMNLDQEIEALEELVDFDHDQFDPAELASLSLGQAFFVPKSSTYVETPRSTPISFRRSRRVVPHVRHLHKYLKSPLPPDKRFYFRSMDGPSGMVAASLWEFQEALETVPDTSLEYHLVRGDFERWVDDVMHDKELARRFRKIARRPFDKTSLRASLQSVVADRYVELESLI